MGAAEPGGRGPDGPDPGKTRRGSEENSERGGGNGIRSETGTAAESEDLKARGGAVRDALYHAPHRQRWAVDGDAEERSRDALSGLQLRRALAARRVADSVCGLRGLAASLAGRRRARRKARVLAKTTGGDERAGTADGPPSTGSPERSGREL